MQNIYAYMDIEIEIGMHKWFSPTIQSPSLQLKKQWLITIETKHKNAMDDHHSDQIISSIHGSTRNKIEHVTNIYEDVIKY